MFDGLKARLDRLFADPAADRADRTARLHEALVEAKVGVGRLREALTAAEGELAAEQRQQADAERRGAMAAEIGDAETTAVAARFAARHAERAAVLAKKVDAVREELALAERDVAAMTAELKAAPAEAAGDSVRAAWATLESLGGASPDTDVDGRFAQAEAERKLKEQAVAAQLEYLKQQLRKD